ncbi:hypothetical protein [Mesorhizobium ventifaucium]|uniref:Uncharacterized protein n=1 Tax=Mesorhizobium ventifaucium TaxID=666020 RepID=A0ABM9DF96_9HYPH|nr:hypothetical protein [Mesorhizobium ventifaucium]CAH2395239.1 hypothetical protein MES4922_120041 [Mesorhizobium ventifaucium]
MDVRRRVLAAAHGFENPALGLLSRLAERLGGAHQHVMLGLRDLFCDLEAKHALLMLDHLVQVLFR